MMMMPMEMLINWGTEGCFLFSSWLTTTTTEFTFAVLMTFMFSSLYPFLVKYIAKFPRKTEDNEDLSKVYITPNVRLNMKTRLILSLLHLIRMTWTTLIMLIFMTYNGYVLIAIPAGLALGYFVFNGDADFKSKQKVEVQQVQEAQQGHACHTN